MKIVQARWQRVTLVACIVILYHIVDESGLSNAPESASASSFSGIKASIKGNTQQVCTKNSQSICKSGVVDQFGNRKALTNPNGSICLRCLLKSSCNTNPGNSIKSYRQPGEPGQTSFVTVNYWHPDKCPTITKYDRRTVEERCPNNSSLILVGDSRTKILFDTLVQKLHGKSAAIIKYVSQATSLTKLWNCMKAKDPNLFPGAKSTLNNFRNKKHREHLQIFGRTLSNTR